MSKPKSSPTMTCQEQPNFSSSSICKTFLCTFYISYEKVQLQSAMSGEAQLNFSMITIAINGNDNDNRKWLW